MKTLLIMRHAKSSWKDLSLADHDRPLNNRGKRDAPHMGRWLEMQKLVPDYIITSTAKRARKTAHAAADAMGFSKEVEETRDFYHAWPEQYIERLQTVPNQYQTVMVVGHNPGMEELVAQLSGQYERIQTAVIAYISLPITDWQDFDGETRGTLNAVWRPKEIPLS